MRLGGFLEAELTTASAPADTTTDTAPVTQPASIAAVEAGDFGALRHANQAARVGKPLAAVEVKPEVKPEAVIEAKPDTPEQRELSNRQKKANDAIRDAVDRATADLRSELAALKAGKPADVAKPAAEPEYKRYLALPNAPKLQDFESVDEHAAAMAVFVADQRDTARAAQTQHQHAVAKAEEQVSSYQKSIQEAGGDEFVATLSPEVRALAPVEYLKWEANEARLKGDTSRAAQIEQSVGPLHVLKSCILNTPALAPKLEKYLSDHPDDLARFRALPDVGSVYVEFGILKARVDSPMPPAAAQPKTLSSAPPPPTTLSTARSTAPADAEHAAVNRHDFRALRAINLAKRQAQRA